MPTAEVVFVRYAVHLLLVVALVLPSGEPFLRSRRPARSSLRGLFLLGSTLLNFHALGYPAADHDAAIMFTGPLWVCMLSIPLLGETVGPRRWTAILVGFAGILVAMRPWSGTLHSAVAFSFGAALCGALYSIFTRKLAGRDSTATQQFYAGLVATLGMAPFAFGDWTWPSGPASWLAFLAIGCFGWGGHQLLIIAHRYAPASTLAPFSYTQIVWMTASSWLIFAQPPDAWILVGAAIVVALGPLHLAARGQPRQRAGATPLVTRRFRSMVAANSRQGEADGRPQDRSRDRREPGDRGGDRRRLRPGRPRRGARRARREEARGDTAARHGEACTAVPCDVTDPDAGRRALRPHRASCTAGSTSSSTTPAPTPPTALVGDIELGGLAPGAVGQPRRRVPDRARAAFRQMRDAVAAGRPDHQQRLDLGLCAASRVGCLHRLQARDHRADQAISLDGRAFDIACGQIDIGNAASDMTAQHDRRRAAGRRPLAAEPRIDVAHVARAVVCRWPSCRST